MKPLLLASGDVAIVFLVIFVFIVIILGATSIKIVRGRKAKQSDEFG